MDSRYDHIKKQLSKDESEIPPQLSWENMEAGILQEMEVIDKADTPKKYLTSVKRLLLALALLLILLLIPFLCTREAAPSRGRISRPCWRRCVHRGGVVDHVGRFRLNSTARQSCGQQEADDSGSHGCVSDENER